MRLCPSQAHAVATRRSLHGRRLASVRHDAEELGWSPDEPLAGYKRQHVK